MAFFEVKNLKKSFDEVEVLKGIDISLEKGEVMSIIGSSGSGKTTLLRCLNNLETADQGEIIVDGKIVFQKYESDLDNDEIKTPALQSYDSNDDENLTFGLVFQSFNLFPQYTALQNITLAMNSKAERELKKQKLSFLKRRQELKIIKEENAKIGLELLKSVGLLEKADFYPCQLSGGQCQRVAIARAMALKPSILCFDEPTSALDPELTGEVLKVINELKNNSNITMIIVTHEMEFAKNISDKVLFMANGQKEEFGPPSQVFDNPESELTKQFLHSYNEQ